jgi:3-hydroxybutyryl-CoA dehydratase
MNRYKFDEIRIGSTESFSILINQEMMTAFTEISGDINPLHVDKSYAMAKGFKDKVCYGMFTSSFYSTLVGVYLPGEFCILQGIDITFSSPVYIGDLLTIKGEVGYMNDAYRVIEVNASITNQDSKKVSKAKIKVGFL